MDEKKYSQLYQALLQEVLQFHSGNQRRIRKGMLSLLLVPLAFLVLLFLSDGSRVIFLLLWIVSMFGIAAYLIAVEYVDYEMQNKVKKITQNGISFEYEYDSRGNIVSEKRGNLTTTYAYDALGQLIRVNDPHENATWVYN